MPQATHPAAIG
ncbi:hypothetical protein YPPY96_2450, partial [Yersinia pestis PY-96]